MTCRDLVLTIALILAGCAEDVPIIQSGGTAGQMLTLSVAATFVPDDLTTFRWELVTAPDGSVTGGPRGDAPTSTFIPDVRGGYLVDRWLVADLSERLTHHIVVTVGGVAPEATVRGDGSVAVGTTAVFDGASSRSIEGRLLTYRWRLATRPAGSQAALGAVDAAQTALIADVVGEYAVELAVFDGELWSTQPASFTVLAHLP